MGAFQDKQGRWWAVAKKGGQKYRRRAANKTEAESLYHTLKADLKRGHEPERGARGFRRRAVDVVDEPAEQTVSHVAERYL